MAATIVASPFHHPLPRILERLERMLEDRRNETVAFLQSPSGGSTSDRAVLYSEGGTDPSAALPMN